MKSNKSESKPPSTCPRCGMKLRLVTGEFGRFLGCTGYPECDYTINVQDNIQCPSCGKLMQIRGGQYGKFLGCSGFPDCKFTYDIRESKKKEPMKKIEMFIDDAAISIKKLRNILKKDWLNLDEIAKKLKIKDKTDIKFLQMQLKKLERNNELDVKIIDKKNFWKMK